ncbi:MAG: LysE family translocator [Burkholderiaceae bacterium]|nr:LysE family translocator [Burkholderiaceae bacterium]
MDLITAPLFGLFLLAALALAITPGPGIAYVLARTVSGGRADGLASTAGTALGGLVHVAAAAAGLSALLMQSAGAFTVVRYVGAVYLVYLGMRTLLARPAAPAAAPLRPRGTWRAFGEGVVVEALNVKTAIFFLAFLPQFIDPALPPVQQFILLGAICVAFNTAADVAVVLGASVALARWHAGARLRAWLQRVSGATMVALGVGMALLRHER